MGRGSGDNDEVKSMLGDYAESSSLPGIANLHHERRWYIKILWAVLLLGLTIAWLYHSYHIAKSYAAFDTTTSVAIVYKPAPFPSVTMCNINPAKVSLIPKYGSAELADFVEDISPTLHYQHELAEKQQENIMNSTTPSTVSGRRKLLQSENYFYENYVDQPDFYAGKKGILNWAQIANEADDNAAFLQDPNAAPYSKALLGFQEMLADIPDTNRTEMGHLLTDMMLYCSYDGKHCSASNFTRSLDINYGNCWTFNSATTNVQSLMSKRSGTKYGLDMILFIDDKEYIEGLQLGRGVRFHIHAHKTLPFVNDNGMSMAPGRQGFVSIRLINQTRLGGLYGTCDDDKGQYVKYYNQKYLYTLEGCEHTCLDRSIAQKCKCYRKTQQQYYNPIDRATLPVCTNESTCASQLVVDYDNGLLSCGCNQACHTLDYQVIPSYDEWPDKSLWYGLVDAVCVREPQDCADFRNISIADRETILRRNFLHLKIYYQQLNIEEIDENPAYEAAQFASDLGGTIGLWIGATIVTLVELFELGVYLCSYLVKNHMYNNVRRKSMETELCNRRYSNQTNGNARRSSEPVATNTRTILDMAKNHTNKV